MDAGVPNAEHREPAGNSIRMPAALRDRIGQMIMVGFRGMSPRDAQPTMRNIAEGSVGAVVLFDVDAETGGPAEHPVAEQLRELVAALKDAARSRFSSRSTPRAASTTDSRRGTVSRPPRPAATMGERNDLAFTRPKPGDRRRAGASRHRHEPRARRRSAEPGQPDRQRPTPELLRRIPSSWPPTPASSSWPTRDLGVLTALKHFPGMGGVLRPYSPGVGELIEDWSDGRARAVPDPRRRRPPRRRPGDPGHPPGNRRRRPGLPVEQDGRRLLRKDIGFDGVVITDAMEMLPIWDVYGFERGILKAINAGCDILLFCNESGIVPYSDERAPAAVQVILDAVERGEIAEERINRACARILALKARRRRCRLGSLGGVALATSVRRGPVVESPRWHPGQAVVGCAQRPRRSR